jgi:hypothetical protein
MTEDEPPVLFATVLHFGSRGECSAALELTRANQRSAKTYTALCPVGGFN